MVSKDRRGQTHLDVPDKRHLEGARRASVKQNGKTRMAHLLAARLESNGAGHSAEACAKYGGTGERAATRVEGSVSLKIYTCPPSVDEGDERPGK